MANTFTSDEINFIKNNYPKYGPLYCHTILNCSEHKLYRFTKKHNIKKIGTLKHPSFQKINPEKFWNIIDPKVAYFLGFLWADGYIHTGIANGKAKNSSFFHTVSLEIVSEDYLNLKYIFEDIGEWAINARKRNDTWKETTTISTNSKDLYEFLHEHDYDEKSSTEPTKILSKIPDSLKPYWWRGFFDGDGYISIGEIGKRYKHLGFGGSYESSFSSLVNLCHALGVENYSIHRYEHPTKHHKSARFGVQNIRGIAILIKYMMMCEHGLSRKTNKMLRFLEKFDSTSRFSIL